MYNPFRKTREIVLLLNFAGAFGEKGKKQENEGLFERGLHNLMRELYNALSEREREHVHNKSWMSRSFVVVGGSEYDGPNIVGFSVSLSIPEFGAFKFVVQPGFGETVIWTHDAVEPITEDQMNAWNRAIDEEYKGFGVPGYGYLVQEGVSDARDRAWFTVRRMKLFDDDDDDV